jgi:putative membrane protein insertion efficiency factor
LAIAGAREPEAAFTDLEARASFFDVFAFSTIVALPALRAFGAGLFLAGSFSAGAVLAGGAFVDGFTTPFAAFPAFASRGLSEGDFAAERVVEAFVAALFLAAGFLASAPAWPPSRRRRPSCDEAAEDFADCRPRASAPPFAAATFAAAARRMSFAERVLLDVDRATGSLVRALSEAVGSYSLSPLMRQDDHRSERPAPGLLRRLAVAPIRAYRLVLSPWLGGSCRFHPSCSHYAEEAILRFGLLRGGMLMLWRLLRCQPLCDGGEDPVPERFSRAAFPPCRAAQPGGPA